MKRSLLLIVVLLLTGLGSHAQKTSSTDSLSALIKTGKDDTNKVNHLNALARELMYQNLDSSILLSTQALDLSGSLFVEGKSGWTKGLSNSSNRLGVYYRNKGEYAKSLEYFFMALAIDEKLRIKNYIANDLNNIGIDYYYQGDYAKSLEYYFKALQVNIEINQKNEIAQGLNYIGIVYYSQADYPKSLDYYFKALKLDEELGSKKNVASDCNNIGLVYTALKNYDKALEYYFKGLRINEEVGNEHVGPDLNNIGNIYYYQLNYEKALEFYFKSMNLNQKIDNKFGIASTLINIGDVYTIQKKYKEAEENLLKALELSKVIDVLDLIKESNKALSNLYSITKRYELAYKHHLLYTDAKDSLFNEDKSKEIGRLEMRHEIELAEMERIKKAELEQETKNRERKRKNLVQYSGIIFLLGLMALLILILGFRKVNSTIASGVSFLALLLLFEFLLVLFDPTLEKWSGGEPAYKLMFNALIAACIFPVHAIFERTLKKRITRS